MRPLDTRGETPADKGFSHICRDLKFLGIDTPGAFQSSWTVPAFTLHRLPPTVDLRLAALVEPLAVACHDVRRGEVVPGRVRRGDRRRPDRTAGRPRRPAARGGRDRSARSARSVGRSPPASGSTSIDPTADDLPAAILERTGGAGADVVFEVSGSAAGADVMTQLACIRGRVVVVAIFPEPQPVRLFDFFWKELRMVGARVYEPEDYERAIELLAAGALPLERLITAVEPLDRLPSVFEELERRRRDEDPDRLPSVSFRLVLGLDRARHGLSSRASARRSSIAFADAGADVIGVSANLEADGGAVGREIAQRADGSSVGTQLDFGDRAAVYDLIEALRAGPPIDVLVNNAGTIRRSPAAEHGDEDWDEVLEVNLTAQFVLTREIGRPMLERGAREDRLHRVAALLPGRDQRARVRREQGRRSRS